MPASPQQRPMGLLMRPRQTDRWKALSDTPAHAAATALVVASDRCHDPVRSRSVTALFPLVADVESGDGDDARRRSGVVVALVESAAAADPACRPLVLALERWLLHPGLDTAQELTGAAENYVDSAAEELRRRCWSVGAGLDAAVESIRHSGIREAGGEALAAIVEARSNGVSYVWAAHRCGVSREALYRCVRDLQPDPPLATGP